jgi:hypothetical protein
MKEIVSVPSIKQDEKGNAAPTSRLALGDKPFSNSSYVPSVEQSKSLMR